jgi:hypothetical protein
MEKELNKYLPRDITKMILEIHYKSMFTEVLNELNIIVSSLMKDIQVNNYYELDYFCDETGNSHISLFMEEIDSIKYPWKNSYKTDDDDTDDDFIERFKRFNNIPDDDTDDDTDDNE